MKFAGKILVTAYEKGEIGKNKKEMKKAFTEWVAHKTGDNSIEGAMEIVATLTLEENQ